MRVLEELNLIREEASLLILGVCVIEDIILYLCRLYCSPWAAQAIYLSEIETSVGSVIAFIAPMILLAQK
jgi:Kef-type K+ transport system membrane component KefB